MIFKRRHHFAEFWRQKDIDRIVDISAERYSHKDGAASARRYLQETSAADRVDVLMCENDILAIGAMEAARSEFGLRVPDDLAVVGFDNYELGGTPAFGLTTYEQPRQEMVKLIVEMVTGKREGETISLPGKLIVRSST